MPLLACDGRAVAGLAVSGDELTAVLVSHGARLVAHQEHGDFLAIRRRLVFVRRAPALALVEIVDALRMAAMTPARLHEMLHDLRRVRAATRAIPEPA